VVALRRESAGGNKEKSGGVTTQEWDERRQGNMEDDGIIRIHHQHLAFLFYSDCVCSHWQTFTRQPSRSLAVANGLKAARASATRRWYSSESLVECDIDNSIGAPLMLPNWRRNLRNEESCSHLVMFERVKVKVSSSTMASFVEGVSIIGSEI
jgi:hypothetical protein